MPKGLQELTKISDYERNLVKSFADSKKKRHKSSYHKKGQTLTKVTAMPSNKTNAINSLYEGSAGSSFMLSGDNTGDSQVHDICGEHTEDLSINNDSPFLPVLYQMLIALKPRASYLMQKACFKRSCSCSWNLRLLLELPKLDIVMMEK
eukprot:9522711-Ditylum_brightwellii.AAC.1